MSEPEIFKPTSLTITVKLFAAYQDAYGVPELRLELPPGATVSMVSDRLLHDHPELEQWRSLTRFGVNFQFVEPDWVLQDGDEVVLIPPVSGG
ncbi:MAG: MoaD/ThiS family protein [Cyanobacteria bacterium J069]|nr:MAG: MoaD/ThiS family protein [Cyanobacteria bacterium J069]